jgi:uncharacterized protein
MNYLKYCVFICCCFQLFVGSAQSEEYVKNYKMWKSERIKELKSEQGYLNLAGLFWLKEGESTIGSNKSNKIHFDTENTAGFLGTVTLKNGEVWYDPMDSKDVYINNIPATKTKLFPDNGSPVVVTHHDLKWFIIQRGEDYGIRLKDFKGKYLKNFKGIEHYPLNQNLIVEGRFVPTPGRKIDIKLATGHPYVHNSPGKVIFFIDGKEMSLDATGTLEKLSFVFGDETNSEDTYGGGRFLEADGPDANNKVIIDFNRAYNPPCAFTPFATCPLPTKENKLAISIRAGEKYTEHD